MDSFHERLARVALDAAGSFGFALAGGYAVQVHGFLSRVSSDIDLFARADAETSFPEAVDAVITAYQREGFQVEAELQITIPASTGRTSRKHSLQSTACLTACSSRMA